MMAFNDTTESKASFKMIRQKAHTENTKDFYNEPTPSQLLIIAKDLIGDAIDLDPPTAVLEGVAEYIECILVAKSGTNGKAYNLFFPGDYDGVFSTAVSGDPLVDSATATLVRDVTFIIPEAVNTNIVDGPTGPTNGYAPRLLDNGVLVAATASEDWFLDPFACVITSEDNLSLSTTGTMQIYLYTARTVLDRLDANEIVLTNTQSAIFYLENAAVGDAFPIQCVPLLSTITRVHYRTSAAGNDVTFNIEKRPENAPFSAGTDLYSADVVADENSDVDTSGDFNSATIPARSTLWITVSAIESAPIEDEQLSVTVEWTVD